MICAHEFWYTLTIQDATSKWNGHIRVKNGVRRVLEVGGGMFPPLVADTH